MKSDDAEKRIWWQKGYRLKSQYFNRMADEIAACYVVITEYLSDHIIPFPPERQFIDIIAQARTERKRALKSLKEKRTKKGGFRDFIKEQTRIVNKTLNQPIALRPDYFLTLLNCCNYLRWFIDISAKYHQLYVESIDLRRKGLELWANDRNEKIEWIFDQEAKLESILYQLTPPRMLFMMEDKDYRLVARFNEAKGVWTNKVESSRRGQKAAAVRTRTRAENMKIIENICSKYDFDITNKVVAEAMAAVDRGSKTIQNMIGEIQKKRKKTM